MKRQTFLRSTLCLLMALICNVAWAQTNTDGPIVTFTNVQQDGTTTFTLYINENGQLATSSSSAAELGDAAKFRATQQANGKWTFYNEAKQLYMIWRGKDEGHNGDKGVLAEYNATYCDWTLSNGTVLGTHFFYAKRNNTSKEGTLIVMKSSGSFDAWGNTQGLSGTYSNLYRIESEEYTATLTDNQGTVVTCTATGFPLPSYSGATLSNAVWANGKLAATVDAQFSALPFPLSSAEVTNPTLISSFIVGGGSYTGADRFKWYALDEADDVKIQRDATITYSNLGKFSWAIYASLENGVFAYSIKNVAKGKYIYTEASYANNNGSHGDNVVILKDTPTKFLLSTDAKNRFYYVSNGVNQYLSYNSTTEANSHLGVFAKTHDGTTHSFSAPAYDLTSKDELVSGGIYTFVSSKGRMGATENNAKVISTARTSVSDTNTDFFKWALYQSKNGNYYLYNLGKQMFMGVQSGSDAEIDFVTTPVGKTLTFKNNGQTNGYPIMFSTDNNGVVNHSTNHGGGLINWTGGWNKMDDAGSNHKISYIGSLTADQLKTIADLVEAYDKRLYVTAEVEGSWENNPNTHFGRVRATSSTGSITTKLNIDMDVVAIDYDGLNETTIDFTRAYRGFEFQGFYVDGELVGSFTLTDAFKANNTAENPLVAKFTATDDVTLWYDDDPFSYRIPAIGKTSTGRLIAVSDYRYSLDDIGRYNYGTANPGIDLVIRMSDDNGKTWGETKTIAKCSGVRGANDCAYGDAAIAVVGQKVLVMGAAGDVKFGDGSATAHNRTVRIFSEDNGVTWTQPQDISETLFLGDDATIKNGYTAFFGSGKLAVDENYNNTGNARIYGAMLIRKEGNGSAIYVIYTDDFGVTWSILGGSQNPVTSNDEPKVEILPSGQILLSVRRGGGRQFNVFTYTDKATNAGSWNNNVNGCSNGGSNTCNGEIYVVDAKKADGSAVKLLLQSQPKGGSDLYDRRDVTIWYKEITDAAYTSSEIAGNWIDGMQVSNQLSSYSTMVLQNDGKIAFFFEEAPCYGDDYAKGYSMVYVPLTIEGITKGNYFSPNADLTTERTINAVLTDAQGNDYRCQVQSGLTGIAAALTTQYPYITLGNNANIGVENGVYTYTNTVTLPFKVSNEEEIWHNIYYPAKENNIGYPVYMSAAEGSDVVKAVNENYHYGNSSFNTQAKAASISWAFYQVGEGFSFVLKNQLNSQYVKTTSAATSDNGGENVKFTSNLSEAVAFTLEDGRTNSYRGDYALKIGTGYICMWSVNNGYVTYTTNTAHQGGWTKIVEAPDFEALIAEVNATLDMIGTGLGQYTASEANVAAAAAAKEAMKNSATVKLNTLNSYKTLTNGATLNMPVAGQFFRIRGISGNYIDATSIHGNANAKTGQMSMKSAESCNYNGTIFYLDEEKHLLNYATGRYIKETREIGAVGDAKGVWSFAESPRTGKGKYALSCTTTNNNGRHLHDNAGNRADRCSSNCGDRHDFTLEEVTALPVTVTAAQYATFFAPCNVTLPVGLEAYYVSNVGNGYASMTQITNVIPANTGVILKGEQNTYNLTIGGEAETVENKLSGTVASSYITENSYVLSKQNDVVGFYAASKNQQDGASWLNNGFKAYLPMPSVEEGEGARFLVFNFGEDTETAIESIDAENGNVKAEIYDLAGRRVQNAQKGVFIVNGKVVIK